MRYIDKRQIRIPDGWRERARAARDAVAAGECAINDRSAVWAELKNALADLSYDKCWYCEAKQERSDDAVDHFRPKNRVAECGDHDGYSWLAFDESNYRYSCTYCNSRRKARDETSQGKGDSFPLINEATRAYNAGDECNENPMALDPCTAGEPSWLDWRSNGKPVPKFPDTDIPNKKATCAISLYHLDHEGACEARRSIAIDLESWIKQGNRSYKKLCDDDPEAEQEWSDRCQDILKAISSKAPYSAFAKRILMMLRSEASWLDELLQEA